MLNPITHKNKGNYTKLHVYKEIKIQEDPIASRSVLDNVGFIIRDNYKPSTNIEVCIVLFIQLPNKKN